MVLNPLGLRASQAKASKRESFFGLSCGRAEPADLVVAFNVLAMPDINDLLQASLVYSNQGRASIEFPHLLQLLKGNQFDTIYHEHYSYLSLGFVQRIALTQGLEVVDVEQLPTHGGSLRVWLAHAKTTEPTAALAAVLADEARIGLESLKAYEDFQHRAEMAKNSLLEFLLEANGTDRLVMGYGAAAKGNTLLNYAGVKSDLLPVVADRALSKQGHYLPGSHIPVISPEVLTAKAPDALLVLPWNLINEVRQQLPGYELVTVIPGMQRWDALHK